MTHSTTKKTSKLAIDVGGVLSRADTDSVTGGSIAEHLESTHPSAECAEACRFLVKAFGPEHTYILSKCKSCVQNATVRFLNNPIGGLDQSFLEYTGIPPRNVLFCFQRSGGDAPVRLVPLGQRDGPRVAADKTVGKGAVAASLGLTHMIDDREDCLLSFFWEGAVLDSCIKSSNKRRTSKKRIMSKAKKFKSDDEEVGHSVVSEIGLLHFGDHAAKPSRDRVVSFAESRCCSPLEPSSAVCIERWVPVANWGQVVKQFRTALKENAGAIEPETTAINF